jgi:hypothetical protein
MLGFWTPICYDQPSAFAHANRDILEKGTQNMSWHVRYIDRSLKHELLSPEFATKEEALESAWDIAQGENDISAIEGPDEELVSMEEIAAWFDRRASRENATETISPAT